MRTAAPVRTAAYPVPVSRYARASASVVEDDPDCVPHAGADAADTVAEVHAIVALRALYWPVMNGEGHGITLPKRYDLSAALHARPLFGEDKLAACEIRAGL